jgi:hypothetical protein
VNVDLADLRTRAVEGLGFCDHDHDITTMELEGRHELLIRVWCGENELSALSIPDPSGRLYDPSHEVTNWASRILSEHKLRSANTVVCELVDMIAALQRAAETD